MKKQIAFLLLSACTIAAFTSASAAEYKHALLDSNFSLDLPAEFGEERVQSQDSGEYVFRIARTPAKAVRGIIGISSNKTPIPKEVSAAEVSEIFLGGQCEGWKSFKRANSTDVVLNGRKFARTTFDGQEKAGDSPVRGVLYMTINGSTGVAVELQEFSPSKDLSPKFDAAMKSFKLTAGTPKTPAKPPTK